MVPETSIIIRTRNEEKWLGETLKRLRQQTYQDFEIIIVDSGSTDQTLAIVRANDVKLFTITPESFTYPYALNQGILHTSLSTYIVILSAHSLPINNQWLESGITHMKKNPKLFGVYGPLKALPGSTIWDILFHNSSYLRTKLKMWPRTAITIKKDGVGVLGFTNAIIRQDLWKLHHIDESYAGGGEDGEWARYWFSKGLCAVKDLRFTVLHSHNLSFSGWKAQIKHWRSITKPSPFTHHTYRNDRAHEPINRMS
jgi:rhamnosyltransferase